MTGFFPIFIVDDDAEDQLMIQEYFEEINIRDAVKYFDNGQKVVHHLETLKDPCLYPKLIVLDLNMPIMNGTQTLLHIKRDIHYKNIPILIFTTSENDNERRKCLSYGALDYLVKPMTYDEGQRLITRFATFI
ncbi:MAG: response regulator [Chryseolinea sp.]